MDIKQGPPVADLPTDEMPPQRRRGRPPGSKNRPRGSLKTEIGGTLTMLNMAVQLSPFASDALDVIEIEALANALDEQAKQSPTFYRYISYVVKTVSGGGSLVGVCAMIGARRAARHGILPIEYDMQIGNLMALSMGKQPMQPQPVPSSANESEPIQ
jgi:hypothetical protein